MPRYTGLITKCLARGAGKLAVFQHAANDKFPANSQGRGAEFQLTDAYCHALLKKLCFIRTFIKYTSCNWKDTII